MLFELYENIYIFLIVIIIINIKPERSHFVGDKFIKMHITSWVLQKITCISICIHLLDLSGFI